MCFFTGATERSALINLLGGSNLHHRARWVELAPCKHPLSPDMLLRQPSQSFQKHTQENKENYQTVGFSSFMSLDSAALCLWCTVLGTGEREARSLFLCHLGFPVLPSSPWTCISKPVSLSFFPLLSIILLGPLCLQRPRARALHLAQLYPSTNFSSLLLTMVQSVTVQFSAFPTTLHKNLNRSQSLCYLIGYLPSFWRLLWLLHLKSERKNKYIILKQNSHKP